MGSDKALAVSQQAEVLQRRRDEHGAPTPAEMVHMALTKGADPSTLERLLALQEKWDSMQARKAYTAAMASFKATCPAVLRKDARVNFGQTSYKHATLGNIVSEITEHLSRNQLSVGWVTAQPEAKLVSVTCTVTHAMGHSESVTLSGPLDNSGQKNAIQQLGSTVSYLERYTLLAALGLATADQDNDGISNGPRYAGDRGYQQQRQQPQSRPAKQPEPRQEPAQPAEQHEEPRPEDGLTERARTALQRLAAIGVNRAQAELLAGDPSVGEVAPAEGWTDENYERINKAYRDLKSTPEDYRADALAVLCSREPGAEG